MIEANAFLVAFAVQILAASVLSPARLIKYSRGWKRNFSSERFAQLYPGIDYDKSIERFVTLYRVANVIIAMLGVLLLGWLFTLTRHPQWPGEVVKPAAVYFLLQMSPMILIGLYGGLRYYKVLTQPSTESRRTATLQRRGLFDFVSPFVVLLAVLSYVVFVVYAIYLDLQVYHNTSLSRFCYGAIGAVTLVQALNAFIIHKYLYGRKNPLLSREGRAHTIGMTVKASVYSSIAFSWFYSLFGTLGQPDLQEWRPFVLSVFFSITSLLGLLGMTAAPPKPKTDGLDSTTSTGTSAI